MELRQKAQYHKKLQELVITSKFELGFNDSVVESRSCYGRVLSSKLSRIGCLLRKDWRVPACICLFWLHEPDCSFQALSGWQKSWRCGWSSVFSRVIGTRKGLVARQVFVPGMSQWLLAIPNLTDTPFFQRIRSPSQSVATWMLCIAALQYASAFLSDPVCLHSP